MDIALHAQVECTDGGCGQVANLVVDPHTEEVTYVVVAAGWLTPARMVPIDWVTTCTLARVCVDRTRAAVEQAEPYTEVDTLDQARQYDHVVPYAVWPITDLDTGVVLVEHKRIPKGELELRRSAGVIARDGRVGKVDALLVSPQSGAITHLVLREGHLWGRRDVTIPVSEIERIEDNAVYLKLSKRAIESLPAVPMRARVGPAGVSAPCGHVSSDRPPIGGSQL